MQPAPALHPRRLAAGAAGLALGVAALLAVLHPASPAYGTELPPVPADAAAGPLGTPAPLPEGDGPYGFLVRDPDGTPVLWDPCRPVHWVVRPEGEPPGGRDVVRQAVAEVSLRTGLRFVEDGETDEVPADPRPALQPLRYGDRWAPVLVAWSTAAASPDLAGSVAGYAGPVPAQDGGRHLVSGRVLLDVDDLAYGGARLDPFAYAVVLHELGHLVGLAHVDDPAQLMYPQGHIRGLGLGDLHGLAAAGSGPCSTRDP